MENALDQNALDRVTPNRLWTWAAIIAIAGIAVRVVWFLTYEHDLPFAFGEVTGGHLWWQAPRTPAADMTETFAPLYGATLRYIHDYISSDAHTIGVILLAIQSALLGLTTLLTFALSRRVLFGWIALLPAVLLNLSVALFELPAGLAPAIPTMFLLTVGIWLITILQEALPELRGSRAVLLGVGGGFSIGLAMLFNPAVLLAAIPIAWWAFRGLGRDHAVLLLVAMILIPASWLAVAQTQTLKPAGKTEIQAWFDTDRGNVPADAAEIGERAYNAITPWNPRFARGPYASENWNWEWVLPQSVRTDTTYISATRGVFIFLIAAYVVLVLLGLIELFAEGAGSAARLLAIPAVALPLATFVSPMGSLIRIPALPALLVALTLGIVWLSENLRPSGREIGR